VENKLPSQLYFAFYSSDFSENPHYACPTIGIGWLQSFNNKSHFTWQTTYLLSCISPSTPAIFLKLQTYH